MQLVMAAMTTAPWSRGKRSPSSSHQTACDRSPTSGTATVAVACGSSWPGATDATGSDAGKLSAAAASIGRAVVDAEGRQRSEERLLRVAQRHAVLRPPRAGEARLDGREVELDDLRVRRARRRPGRARAGSPCSTPRRARRAPRRARSAAGTQASPRRRGRSRTSRRTRATCSRASRGRRRAGRRGPRRSTRRTSPPRRARGASASP